MLATTIAGSLPKPAWLATPNVLWAPWRLPPETLGEGKRDAVLLALREQERAGIDVVTALNEEARELAALGADVIQLDEPAFNVDAYLGDVVAWGIEALERSL